MAKVNMNTKANTSNKKTNQGNGMFSKTNCSGGETFIDGHRSGSPPSKSRRRKKVYRGQGR
jgi:hypothetical protein